MTLGWTIHAYAFPAVPNNVVVHNEIAAVAIEIDPGIAHCERFAVDSTTNDYRVARLCYPSGMAEGTNGQITGAGRHIATLNTDE